MSKKCVVLGLALSMFCAARVGAQQPATVVEKPAKTKLEAFQAQTGTVVVKGYTFIDKLVALGSVEVLAMEFTDATSGEKQTGVVIEIKEGGRLENTDRSFIDYEEIDSLLKGIDYISKATAGLTKLNNFETTYATKGNFKATTFSRAGKIEAAVSSGYIRPAQAFLSLPQLGELRLTIERAKQKLDSLK